MNRLLGWFNIILKRQKKFKRWQRIVTALAAIMTFVTTYALILPAITVEKNSTEMVGGLHLEQTVERDDFMEENAPEPNGVSIDEEIRATADETDAEIPDYDESQEEAAPQVKTLNASGSDYTVILTYDESSRIPEEADLTVSEIDQESEEYQNYLYETKKAMGIEEEEALPNYAARFFDIKILVNNEEFIPESGVNVEITYAEPLAEYPDTEVNAVHFADESAEAEVIEASTADVTADGNATVEFTAESFSVYGVIYTVDFLWEVDGNRIETKKADAHLKKTILTADEKTFEVTVTYDSNAGIPQDAKLYASEITEDSPLYKEYYAEAEKLADEDKKIMEIRIFDISIFSGDDPDALEEIEPIAPVDVCIKYAEGMELDEDGVLKVVHFTESEPEILENEAERNNEEIVSVSFTTESFSSFATVSEQFTTKMEQGCIAYFSFDDETSGFSGAGARAARHGSNDLRTGYSGTALYLDQPNQANIGYLTVDKDNGSSLLTGLDEFTVAYWVRPTANTSDGSHGNWAYYAAPNGNQQTYRSEKYIATSHQNGNVTSERYNSNNNNRPAALTDNSATPLNEWHHVAVVYKNGKSELYIDGVLTDQENSNVDLSNMLGNNSIFQIGKANWERGQGFRGYLDEFAVFNYPLAADEINILKDEKGMIALSPMNENGILPGDPVSGNITSTSYKNMTIDGHTVSGQNDLQYSRLFIPVTYNADGTATITLPSNEQLTQGFRVSEAEDVNTSHTILQDPNKPQYKLVGWVNIADEDNNGQFEYYNVKDGPATVTVSRDNLDVFYADWVPVSYDHTFGNLKQDVVDTSSFVKIGMWDYNELYNLNTSTAYKVDQDARRYQPRDTLAQEEWYINHTVVNGGDFVQFVDNTAPSSCWQYGTIGNTQDRGREDENRWSNYNGWAPRFGIVGQIGQETSTHVIGDLFDTSNTPGSGVYYLGEGNYLFSYDASRKRYSFDSQTNGAVYNQTDERFYVSNDTSLYTTNHGSGQRGFLPLNDPDSSLAYNNGSINYWFGMSTEIRFWLPDQPGTPNANKVGSHNEDMVFEFRGDDDVWVFIDDKLALDIGGIHEALNGTINFTTGDVYVQTGSPGWNGNYQTTKLCNIFDDLGIGAGAHKLTFYYVERGANESNCHITFNITPRWVMDPVRVDTTKVTKNWSDDTPASLKETLGFSLKTTENETIDTVGYDDGTIDAVSGKWTYVWEALDPDKEYVVEETHNPAFVTDVAHTTVENGKYNYWAATAYDDADEAFNMKTLLLGNGLSGAGAGKLLKSNGGSVESTEALIRYEVVDGDSVSDPVKWTVTDYSKTNMHFYIQDSNGKYLSIRNGIIELVTSKTNASLFYMAPTGDLNDADSQYRLIVDNSGAIGVGIKKSQEYAGIESEDRVHLYAYQEITTKTFDYTVTNRYVALDLDIIKMDASDMTTPLEKAQFELKNLDPDGRGTYITGDSAITKQSGETGTDGKTSINSIPTGYYEISEIKMPAGYIKVEDGKFYISVNNGVISRIVVTQDNPETDEIDESLVKNWTVVGDNDDGILRFSAARAAVQDDPDTPNINEAQAAVNATFKVGNTAGAALPNTGGPGTSLIYILGFMLTALAGACLVSRKKAMVFNS